MAILALCKPVREYNVTGAQYIGELARYILATPAQPGDESCGLLFCTGNGLRPEYWDEFQTRFGIVSHSETSWCLCGRPVAMAQQARRFRGSCRIL